MSYPAIEAKGVRFSYGKNEILHGMDFAAQKGQLIAVLGPNGAGKSTLFRCLLGLYHSYQGSITIEGREVKNMQPREIAAKVAYIPQTHTPTFHYTVLEMVLMGTTHRVRGLQSPGAKEVAIAREALAQVGIANMENRSYGRLSGGEQQLVLIARALAQQTELLVMPPVVEQASREIGVVWRPSSTRLETFGPLGDLIGECVTVCSRSG